MRRWTSRGAAQAQDRATAAPAATRQRTARYSDLRLWLGILLLVGSTAAGYLLLSQGEDTVTVWRATRDLAPGTPPTALEQVAVSREVAGDGYARPGDALVGRLRWPIPAGGLVPLAALGDRVPHRRSRGDGARRPAARTGGTAGGRHRRRVVDAAARLRGGRAAAPRCWSCRPPSSPRVAADAIGIGGEIAVVLEVPTDVVAVRRRSHPIGRDRPGRGAGHRRGARVMTVVLLAVPGLAQEPDLVVAAPAHGMQVRRRCVDAADLLAAAATDPAAAIVVSSGPAPAQRRRGRAHGGGWPTSGRARRERVRRRPAAHPRGRRRRPRRSHSRGNRGPARRRLRGRRGRRPCRRQGCGRRACGPRRQDGASPADPAHEPAPQPGILVAVWGPMGAPGRTTIAIALAEALAESGRRTCLVDADTYAPSVAMALGIVEEASGLIVACRHADNGSLTPAALGGLVRQVRPRVGRPGRSGPARPLARRCGRGRWTGCGPPAASPSTSSSSTSGFCLEDDESAGPWSRRRNAAALTALAAADRVVAVADASAAGAARVAHAWPELADRAPGARLALVRNRAAGPRPGVDRCRAFGGPARAAAGRAAGRPGAGRLLGARTLPGGGRPQVTDPPGSAGVGD